MNLTEEVALYLHSEGIATYDKDGLSGNVFLQTSPASPDVAFSIYSTGGPSGDRRNEYGKATIQVLIRTVKDDPRQGEDSAQEVIRSLNGFSSARLTDGGHYIIDTEALQDAPNNIGQDENGRFEYSQNFIFEYKI